jgi:hypothetical protein
MFKPIAKYLLQQQVAKDNRLPSLVHGDLLKSIAVIAEAGEAQFPIVQAYVNELRLRGIKTVDFFVCFPNQKSQDTHPMGVADYGFNRTSFNFLGKIKSQDILRLCKDKYEVLIDLTTGESLESDIVIANLKAKWKAGRMSPKRQYLLDFMINTSTNDMRNLVHHLNSYLTKFNSSNAA